MRSSLLATSFLLCLTLHAKALATDAPTLSIATHDAFFKLIQQHCGRAYEGKVVSDFPASGGFEGRLVMHVRRCTETELQIPFHVGDNHSRTWIIRKTGSGLQLKHDHRHVDGHSDVQTMYGGHTTDVGWEHLQSFPADVVSKALFVQQGMPQSVTNVWQIAIYPHQMTYRLIRESREFRVSFDLTKPVEAPPAPWGYQD